jgi:hypothetical protein
MLKISLLSPVKCSHLLIVLWACGTIFKPYNSQEMFRYLIFIDWNLVFTVAIEQVMHDLGGCWRVTENCYACASIGSCLGILWWCS